MEKSKKKTSTQYFHLSSYMTETDQSQEQSLKEDIDPYKYSWNYAVPLQCLSTENNSQNRKKQRHPTLKEILDFAKTSQS
jgi:hypothetical protein